MKTTLSEEQTQDILVKYRPRVVDEAQWDDIRPYVLASLERLRFGSKSVLQDEMILFTRFTAWCRALGLPLEHEATLTPTLMEAYFADPTTPKPTPGNKWSFTRWGRALTRDAPWPPQRKDRTGTARSLFRPYTDEEVTRAWTLAPRQTTELRRRTATVLIGLCEGAGVTPDEAKWATGTDLEKVGGVLCIRVEGRIVPIRTRYAAALEQLAVETAAGAVLTGRNPETYRASDLTSVILHHTDLHQAPRLSGRRLRHTWIRRQIEHDTPIRDIYHAAGAIDAKTLLDALRSLKPNNTDEYLRNLLPHED